MEDCITIKTFVEKESNSLHDPSLDLDLTNFLELDTSCTYDSNMCDEINSTISPISFLLTSKNPIPNIDPLLGIYPFPHKEITIVVDTLTIFENDDLFEHFDFFELSNVDKAFFCNSCTSSYICQICVEIDKCITCDVDIDNTTPGLPNELELKNATIETILKANPLHLQVFEISESVSSLQLPLKELEPILIPTLIDSNTDYTCDLCCDSSVCCDSSISSH